VGCGAIKNADGALVVWVKDLFRETCEDVGNNDIRLKIERQYGLVEEIINIRDTTDSPRIDDVLSPSNPYVTAKDADLICEGDAMMVYLANAHIEFWRATGKDGEVYIGAR